ncbi:MAG: PQ-loop repeat-containing protein [Mycoplasma sp.]|nr:PQ-loop repeat-containing protein [Candidatus Hennigella equi]
MNDLTLDILALVFGCISIVMSLAIEVPQLYSLFKTKNTSGTSLTTYILFLVASMFWVIWATSFYLANMYGTESEPTPLHLASFYPAILSNSINLILVASILSVKLRHLRLCKKYHISELQLSKIMFDRQKKYSWIKKFWPFLVICISTFIVCIVICLAICFTYTPFQYSEEQAKTYHIYVTVFNITAAVFFEAVSWPQFIKCMKNKDTSGISLGWAIFLPLSCFVCLSYNISLAISTNVFDVLASIICSGLIINTLVLILKIKNRINAKRLGMSEWTYTNKYLSKRK